MRTRWTMAAVFLETVLLSGTASAGTVRGTVTLAKGDVRDAVVAVEGVKVAGSGATAEIDQRDLAFAPHVLPIVVGTKVEFKNGDTVFHNVASPSKAGSFNFGIMRGRSVAKVFDQPGVVNLLCNVHSEMRGFLLVKENPYFAQPTATGSYSIPNVPAGTYRLSVWHPGRIFEEKSLVVPANGDVVVDFTLQQATR